MVAFTQCTDQLILAERTHFDTWPDSGLTPSGIGQRLQAGKVLKTQPSTPMQWPPTRPGRKGRKFHFIRAISDTPTQYQYLRSHGNGHLFVVCYAVPKAVRDLCHVRLTSP